MVKTPMSVMLGSYMPRIRLRLTYGSEKSPEITGLVDSGAGISLAHISLAKSLKLDVEYVRSRSVKEVRGVTGNILSYEMNLGVALGRQEHGGPLVIDDARIYFVDGTWGFDAQVLIGQDDLLRRLTFWQRNHDPKPHFGLKFP